MKSLLKFFIIISLFASCNLQAESFANKYKPSYSKLSMISKLAGGAALSTLGGTGIGRALQFMYSYNFPKELMYGSIPVMSGGMTLSVGGLYMLKKFKDEITPCYKWNSRSDQEVYDDALETYNSILEFVEKSKELVKNGKIKDIYLIEYYFTTVPEYICYLSKACGLMNQKIWLLKDHGEALSNLDNKLDIHKELLKKNRQLHEEIFRIVKLIQEHPDYLNEVIYKNKAEELRLIQRLS